MPTKETEIIPIATHQNVFPNGSLKRGSAEKIDDFLRTPKKTSKRKRRLINASKRKLSMDKSKPKTALTSTLDHSEKEGLPILTPKAKVSTFATTKVDVAMIGADTYCAACNLKGAQDFTFSIKDLKYQAEKKARPETDPKNVVPEEYHNLLDVFSKKDSDILPSHRKYDHKIILEKKQKHYHTPLYKMSIYKLDTFKRYLELHLTKGFIQANSAFYSSPVFFIRKPGRGTRFCVDY